MSKRWFILAFSILFLFAFRAWIDDVSSSDNSKTSGINTYINSPEKHITPLIFPASLSADPDKANGWKFIELPLKKESTPDVIPFSKKESMYIFPTWPDSLIFDFQEVVVDNNLFLDRHNDSSF